MQGAEGPKLEQVRNTLREFRTRVSPPPKPCSVPQSFPISTETSNSFVLNNFTITYKAINYAEQVVTQLTWNRHCQCYTQIPSDLFYTGFVRLSPVSVCLTFNCFIYDFLWGNSLEPLSQFPYVQTARSSQWLKSSQDSL